MGPKTKTQAAGATGKEQAPARSIQSYFVTTKAAGGGGAPAAGAGSTPTTAPKKRASPFAISKGRRGPYPTRQIQISFSKKGR